MRLLVTGGSGYTGGRLVGLARAAGHDVTGTSHSTRVEGLVPLDVRDRAAVDRLLDELRPDTVVHTSYAQSDWAVTALGAAWVAAAAARTGARLVHVSSDAVFTGRPAPYTEADLPEPVYPYGAAKAAAETAVLAVHPDAAVVRTSLIIGDDNAKQHQLALDMAAGRVDGVLFTDHIRHPVAVDDLAAALLELAEGDHRGVIHVAGPEAITRHALGVLIASRHGIPADRVASGSAIDRGIISPAEVRLDTTLAESVLRTRLRGATEILA
ncbi:dTDP-4-dehydrorhamnose reductase [Catellatospora methionotrophica]|uniref:dTDP-4-dehydrorhamnose reductase n=1 Tax=Catellatospora methionotrophica TaxID=121620 RepID=A0A8J3LR96_9ACTN|nr:sugar nucleotide-binding protein [Catellatospora methionotrophica]GIG17415.1 dTDP-4-dehydrorhamnose reductase [Catellatospora methionotrophica]